MGTTCPTEPTYLYSRHGVHCTVPFHEERSMGCYKRWFLPGFRQRQPGGRHNFEFRSVPISPWRAERMVGRHGRYLLMSVDHISSC